MEDDTKNQRINSPLLVHQMDSESILSVTAIGSNACLTSSPHRTNKTGQKDLRNVLPLASKCPHEFLPCCWCLLKVLKTALEGIPHMFYWGHVWRVGWKRQNVYASVLKFCLHDVGHVGPCVVLLKDVLWSECIHKRNNVLSDNIIAISKSV